MTDISEESRSQDRASATGIAPATSIRARFFLLAVAGVAVAGAAILGYSSLYCRELVGAVFWAFFIGVGGPAVAATDSPGLFWMALLAYVAVVFIGSRQTRFRLTWSRFALAIVASYIVAALITWIFVSPGVCNLA